MELGKLLKHAYAISIVVLLYIIDSLSLGHLHANVTRCVERERDVLLAVKRNLVDNHNLLSSWGSGSEAQQKDCCRWERVYCDNQTGHVLRLDLGADNPGLFTAAFEGKISPQLTQLHDLTYLNLSYNYFNWNQIPAFIGSLTSLRYLDLHFAGFGGQIPSHALGNLTHLTYLDLGENYFYWSPNPAFIGSLTSLRYLDLSWTRVGGHISSHFLGNLTRLQYLNLEGNYFPHSVENLNWLPHLSSLKYLDLSDTNLSNVFDWLEIVNKLPNLRNLSLSDCGLPPPIISSSFSHINSSKSLARVDLYGATAMTSLIFKWLCNYNTTLIHLDLSYNQLSDLIPDVFRNMRSLKYLSLSSNQLSGLIPDLFTNMSSLEHLDLSGNHLSGLTPHVFRNMSSLADLDLSNNPLERGIRKSISQLCILQSLDISGCSLDGLFSEFVQRWSSSCPQNSLQSLDLSSNDLAGSFPNLTNFSSLKELFLSANQLSGMIPASIGKLSSLAWLYLSENRLSGRIPESIGQLLSLEDLDISGNKLSGRIPESIGNLSSLGGFYLDGNLLSGTIPDSFGQLSLLTELDLAGNQLCGIIPKSIWQLSSLGVLHLSGNRLSGMIPESIGNLSSLEEIDLSENLLTGITESIGQLSLLGRLDLSRNRLSGRIPQSIGQLSNLWSMNLSMNSLNGVILETHFSNLSGLDELDISSNSLVFNVTSDWVPPFQLLSLNLRFCNVGPDFPQWLRTQKYLSSIDISYAGISDVLPSWFWGHFANKYTIDLSHNQIRGALGSLEVISFSGYEVQFSSNQFEGPIPSFLSNATYLDLSDNKFSKMTSFLCTPNVKRVQVLILSSNNFLEELPDCWRSLVNLELLDLSNNAFSGKIPTTIDSLLRIETLKLRANRLVGELPSSLKNCTSLKVIDLGDNNLSRLMPEWLGASLPNLVILMLQSNRISGSLPSQLCHLTRIQILDLSINEISGTIPKCLNNLTSLSQERNSSLTISQYFNTSYGNGTTYDRYDNDATFMWKGRMSSYKSTLGLVKRIDLSSNRLTGEIPSEITHLVGLVSLNLSRNHLTGQITPDIGKLRSLDSLDLSRNKIEGGIPTSLAQIDRLGYLDLSYNDLSGKIPTGTQLQGFDPSFYDGNPQLCGRPLKKICDPEGISRPNVSSNQEDHDKLIMEGFYISLGLGFAVGFWGVCGSLIFKRSWRYAYYKFLNASNDWIYVKVALIKRKLKDVLNR